MRAYHFGPRFLVELEIVMHPDTPLRESHDCGILLQHKIEALPAVERAFVHIDYAHRDDDDHDHATPVLRKMHASLREVPLARSPAAGDAPARGGALAAAAGDDAAYEDLRSITTCSPLMAAGSGGACGVTPSVAPSLLAAADDPRDSRSGRQVAVQEGGGWWQGFRLEG